MSDYEAQEEETGDELEAEEDTEVGATSGKAQRTYREQALRDLGRAQKMMRSDGDVGADMLLRSATVRAILDLTDAIRESKS